MTSHPAPSAPGLAPLPPRPLRIVMLGWEFPPFISGGLGTACHGLTKALDKLGHEVFFILPRPVDRSQATHIKLLSPDSIQARATGAPADPGVIDPVTGLPAFVGEAWSGAPMPGFARTQFMGVPAGFASPYPGARHGVARPVSRAVSRVGAKRADGTTILAGDDDAVYTTTEFDDLSPSADEHGRVAFGKHGAGPAYQGDLFAESERYARLVVALTRGLPFDVIHAHDWLTFPAGIALARTTGKPLLVHVHSTEFDRSGEHVHQRVYDVERRGMMAAARVICVSELTKSIAVRRYRVPESKVTVVYNGIDQDAPSSIPESFQKTGKDKVVLFLGRITMQKGPEYFIAAAKKVLEVEPNVKFIVAGAGDMEARMIELAAGMGIGQRVLFTGFLRGRDVERVYRLADCYVMPSVSEPFGIAPLEAMRADVPVIISKQSGVSEVLTHALKVDFWDIHEMANKIVAVLRHPPLSRTLREHGAGELKRLTWEGAAAATLGAIRKALAAIASMAGGAPRL